MYRGKDCVFAIDGMDAIEAGYHYAGVCGVHPRGHSLRQLWMMGNGREQCYRRNNLELASLVWGLSDIDWEAYLLYGEMSQTGAGGPVQLSPDLRAKVDAEVDRIRSTKDDLPKFRSR